MEVGEGGWEQATWAELLLLPLQNGFCAAPGWAPPQPRV